MEPIALTGAAIHDGAALHRDKALLVRDGRVAGLCTAADLPSDHRPVVLNGGTLLPGFVDLQVNGGGGVMFNDDQSVETLASMAAAHRGCGTAGLLATLITDTPARSQAAVQAVKDAIAQDIPGIIGLHLEGPHLSQARKGAHDPDLIRPMAEPDVAMLLEAAEGIANVMVTVAPETVTPGQITLLSKAGIIVSLGHSDAGYDICCRAMEAGARCTTHLFNAMSQLSSREPGLVGATLDTGQVAAGMIADAIHVHPATIRAALRAKAGPGRVFLVTDAMAATGTDMTEFQLNGRRILRAEGRLTLADGTLAGADLEMPRAVRVMAEDVGLGQETAIAMATSIPAGLLRDDFGLGRLDRARADTVILLDGSGAFSATLDALIA